MQSMPSILSFGRIMLFFFAAASSVCWAELQNVEVGGKVEIYGAWYSDVYEPNVGAVRIPDFLLPYRPIGPNGDGIGDGVLFVDEYGLTNIAGTGADDADYLYVLTTVEF